MVYLVVLIMLVALTASLTRLATTDEITAPMRVAAREKYGPQSKLVKALDCDRCAAWWLSVLLLNPGTLAILATVHLIPSWLAALAWIPSAFATSYLAFLLILRGEA